MENINTFSAVLSVKNINKYLGISTMLFKYVKISSEFMYVKIRIYCGASCLSNYTCNIRVVNKQLFIMFAGLIPYFIGVGKFIILLVWA